ncbi:MAG: D-alanyl-D-alanine carboxypeptidase [Firmicutes bacterium]|nr:D-alanyl-D-alanine carboxypeptidase [Bacillota bacterium]
MPFVQKRTAAIILLTALCLSTLGVVPVRGQELDISAKAAVLMEARSGEVIYEKDMHLPLPMASITKIMTLVLALEAIEAGKASFDDIVTTSEYAANMGGSQIWLEVGEQMTMKDMLYAIAVGSANDAAVAVAEYLSGSEANFAAEMNRRAQELGMKNTVFSNASGLPPRTLGLDAEHHSSAYDLALLSRHAVRVPHLIELVSTHEYTMRPDTTGKPHLYTLNELLDRVLQSGRRYGYPGLDGIKTGMTSEAGFCLAATAERDGMRLISVVLGAPTKEARRKDTVTLLDYGFRTYEPVTIARPGEPLGEAVVSWGKEEKVSVSTVEELTVGVPRGSQGELTREIDWKKELVAPLRKGEVLGELVVKRSGMEIARVEIVADSDVERANIVQMLLRMSKRLLQSIVPGQSPNR